jgi:amino acid adenylation domain-containing protein
MTAAPLIAELLDRAAESSPEALAAEDHNRSLSYSRLAAEVSHMASRLTAAGVRPGGTVGVMMRHSADLLVSILGVMRAGAAYVPIDLDYPVQRKRFLAADSGFRLLITDSPQDSIPGLAAISIQPDRLCRDPRDGKGRAGPEDLACVIYTSGSTGRPKGVMLTHLGIANLAAVASAQFDMKPDDRYLMLAPAAFSASLEELFPPLFEGAASVFPPDRAALSPASALMHFLQSRQITVLELQTAHWHVLLRHLDETGAELPPSLRLVIIGGDRAQPEAIRQWNRYGIPLVHVYGPTETTATATYWSVPPGQMPHDAVLSIGEPIPRTRIYIVDERLELAGAGTPGELLVGGDSLARGYLGRPAATAERFIADRFSGRPGDRLYRTGDLVRFLPDGRLQFLGRADQQIKVHGHRIEPAEIEDVLHRHPAVRHAMVTAAGDGSGEQRLVAYVAAAAGAVSMIELRAYLAAELPAHLLPSALVRVDEFPMTVHRKIDIAALPDPPRQRPDLAVEFVPPVGKLEGRLCTAAAKLLGLDEIGVVDDLLDLGGDSLFMLRMISWIRSNLGVTVSLRDVFADYSARGMAKLAAQAGASADS